MNRLSAAGEAAAQAANRSLVEALQQRVEQTLATQLSPGMRVALLGFPDYWNPGDSALWSGTLAVFERLGVELVHVASARGYRAETLRNSLGDGLVVLSGGGNCGDLWPGLQAFREQVLKDTAGRTVLQLPQSIHFNDHANLQRFKAVISAHGDYRLLVRDQRSLEVAVSRLGLAAELCPDMAFGLGPLARTGPGTSDVLWLKRADREAQAMTEPGPGSAGAAWGSLRVLDWVSADGEAELQAIGAATQGRLRRQIHRQRRLMHMQQRLSQSRSALGRLAVRWLPSSCARLAQLRTERGLHIVSSGRVVVTDRLHGHILCVLAGIPHLCLDNSYGKVSGCWQAWTHETPVGTFAASQAEAFAQLPAVQPSGPA